MYQHTTGAMEFGVALSEQEMETVMGGDAALWHAVGFMIGYAAREIIRAAVVMNDPSTLPFEYNLY